MTSKKWPLAVAAGAFTTALIGGVAFAGFQPFAATDDTMVGGPTAGLSQRDMPKDKLKTVLDALVLKNTITQAQADAILQAVKDAAPTPRPNTKPAGPSTPRVGSFPRTGSFVGDLTKAASDYLGMDAKTLATQLREGKSVADIANALKPAKDAAGLIALLTNAANTKVDQAVTDKKLTADQATTLKTKIAAEITSFVNRSFTKPVFPRPATPLKPTPAPTPKS